MDAASDASLLVLLELDDDHLDGPRAFIHVGMHLSRRIRVQPVRLAALRLAR